MASRAESQMSSELFIVEQDVTTRQVTIEKPFSFSSGHSELNFTVNGLGIEGQVVRSGTNISAFIEAFPYVDLADPHEFEADLTPLLALKVGDATYMAMDRDIRPARVRGEEKRGFMYNSWRKLDGTPDMLPGPLKITPNPIKKHTDPTSLSFMLIDITTPEEEIADLFEASSNK